MKPKIVASPGFMSSWCPAWCYVRACFLELGAILPTIYQNGSSSTNRVVHGAKEIKWLH